MSEYDVIILGAGPAGLTAAIYTARAKLKTLVLEGNLPGGNAALADRVDNYPGFPFGIQGTELMSNFQRQAERFGAEILLEEAVAIEDLGEKKRIKTVSGEYKSKAVIIAVGAKRRKLMIPGEEEFLGRGVSYCATCDGPFFKGAPVAVVGGGDAAINEALYLSGIASKVYLIHRREQFRANQTALEKAMQNSNIEILTNKIITAITGEELMKELMIEDVMSYKKFKLAVEGLFVSIGLIAAGENIVGFPDTRNGYVISNAKLETSIPGVFVAGDIREKNSRQIATAVGDGTQAAMSVCEFLKV